MEKPPTAENPAPDTVPSKKAYHPPQFSIYGEVREITKSVGVTGMNDTGVHGNDKSQP